MDRRLRAPIAVALALFLIPAALAGAAVAGEVVGSVKNAGGEAAVLRGAATIPAQPGLRLELGDVLTTGVDGSLGVILRDDAVLSLGPSSRAAIDQFVFSPAEGKLAFVLRVGRGTMAYLSGLIGKLSPETTRFETPVATVGIRGTRLAVRVAD